MIPFWVVATCAAALVQTGRFALQKRLKGTGLTAGGATFARFVFAAPIAVLLAAVLLVGGEAMGPLPGRFWAAVVVGGMGQILATMATVALFSLRNFATGIAFTKTETVLVALFSAVALGEAVSGAGFAAILVGLVGVLFLSLPAGGGWSVTSAGLRGPALGLLAGALFGISAIGYRAATQALPAGDTLTRAAVTLAAVTCFQTLAMLPWLRWRHPGEIRRVFARWRVTALVGVTGMLGSLGWFVAFTLQNAAYVRAVGQVELVFSALVSWLVFRERASGREIAGIGLLGVSLVLLVLVAG